MEDEASPGQPRHDEPEGRCARFRCAMDDVDPFGPRVACECTQSRWQLAGGLHKAGELRAWILCADQCSPKGPTTQLHAVRVDAHSPGVLAADDDVRLKTFAV